MGNGITPVIQGNQNATKMINQFKANPKQYPSLDKDQERALIEKYRNDRTKLNQLLFLHNVRLVFNIAKKYMSKTKDFDGLVMNGMRGLGEAAERFDIDKGIKFVTYAHWWIRKYILQLFDKNKNWIEHHSMSINSPALANTGKAADGHEVTFENFINDYIEPSQDNTKSIQQEISSNESQEICKQMLVNLENDTSLSSTDRAVFIDYFYNKEKTRTIANKYGLEISKVFEIKNAILDKCRDYLVNQCQIKSYDDIIA